MEGIHPTSLAAHLYISGPTFLRFFNGHFLHEFLIHVPLYLGGTTLSLVWNNTPFCSADKQSEANKDAIRSV